jgi:hypothetical protein
VGRENRSKTLSALNGFLARLRVAGYEPAPRRAGSFTLSHRGTPIGEMWAEGQFARIQFIGPNGKPRAIVGIPLSAPLTKVEEALSRELGSQVTAPRKKRMPDRHVVVQKRGGTERSVASSANGRPQPSAPKRKQTPDYARVTEKEWQAHLRRTRAPARPSSPVKDAAWHGAQAKGWRKMSDLPFFPARPAPDD